MAGRHAGPLEYLQRRALIRPTVAIVKGQWDDSPDPGSLGMWAWVAAKESIAHVSATNHDVGRQEERDALHKSEEVNGTKK